MSGRSQDFLEISSRSGKLEPDVQWQFVRLGQALARQGLQFRRIVPEVEHDKQVVGRKVLLGRLGKVEDALIEDFMQE